MSRALFVQLDAADDVQLEHLSRATGQPRAVVARALVKAALAADRLDIDRYLPDRDPDPEVT